MPLLQSNIVRRGAPRNQNSGRDSSSSGALRLKTAPFFTSRAAWAVFAGVTRFHVPISSSSPNRPHADPGGAPGLTGS